MTKKLAIFATHPIQYFAPVYRQLATQCDLTVFYCHLPTPAERAVTGIGVAFDWDVGLLDGYRHVVLENRARNKTINSPFGCSVADVAAIVERGAFDAVLVSGWNSRFFWEVMVACWKRKIPVMVRGDSQLPGSNSLKKWLKFPVYRTFIPTFSAYLWVGERAAEYLKFYGAPSDRMYFSPHCVDNDWWRRRSIAARAARDDVRKELGFSPETTVLLFVGRFVDMKRPFDLVRAVGLCRDLNVAAVFVGDGPLRQRVEKEARSFAVPIIFPGFKNQSELPLWYSLADALVLPSTGSETWGLVVNEAMACGTPAIVSQSAGCSPDMIDESMTGFTFPTGDVGALALRVRQLTSLRDTRHDFGTALQKKLETYSVERAADGILEALCAQ